MTARNVKRGVMALKGLPEEHRHTMIDKLLGKVFDGNIEDVILIQKFFRAVSEEKVCSLSAFEKGFTPKIECSSEVRTFGSMTYARLALLLKAAGLSKEAVQTLAGKLSVTGNPLVAPSVSLMHFYENL